MAKSALTSSWSSCRVRSKLFKQGADGILQPRLFDLAMYGYLSGVQPGVDIVPMRPDPDAGEQLRRARISPATATRITTPSAAQAQQELNIDNFKAAYEEPLTIINRDLPTFPLFQRVKIGAYKEGVTGAAPNATMNQDTYNTEEWDIVTE